MLSQPSSLGLQQCGAGGGHAQTALQPTPMQAHSVAARIWAQAQQAHSEEAGGGGSWSLGLGAASKLHHSGHLLILSIVLGGGHPFEASAP